MSAMRGDAAVGSGASQADLSSNQQQTAGRWASQQRNFNTAPPRWNAQNHQYQQQNQYQQQQQHQQHQRSHHGPRPYPQQQHHRPNQNQHGGSRAASSSSSSSASPPDPKPFALALVALARRFGGGASGSAEDLAQILKNITSFTSLNPFLSNGVLPPAQFASHTLRGLVYRRSGGQGHGSCAITEIGGRALAQPLLIWGDLETRRPFRRFDSDEMVDFATETATVTSITTGGGGGDATTAPTTPLESVMMRRSGGRTYTVFKYVHEGAAYACIKPLTNSPFWRVNSFDTHSSSGGGSGGDSRARGGHNNQRRGAPPPPANNLGIATDSCTLALFDLLAREQLIPPPTPLVNDADTMSDDVERASASGIIASSAAAPSSTPLHAAFHRLFSTAHLQSLTLEWSGSALDDDECVTTGYTYDRRLTPLFFQDGEGAVELCVEALQVVPEVQLERAPFDNTTASPALTSRVRDLLAADTARNHAFRVARRLAPSLDAGRFVETGRTLCFVESSLAASSTATVDPATSVRHRLCYLLEPSDLESARDECTFNGALEQGLREAVESILRGPQATAAITAAQAAPPTSPLPHWLAKQVQTRVVATRGSGISAHRYRAVRQSAEAFARTLLLAASTTTTTVATPLDQTTSVAAAAPPTVGVAVASDQCVLVLIAFPGAGKSFFSERLLAATAAQNAREAAAAEPASADTLSDGIISPAPRPHLPRTWVRVNQDLLGSRKQCESAASRALRAGHSVIVDRTNIDVSQRATWISLARQYGVRRVEALLIDMPPHVCKQRVLDRRGHETLSGHK